jgi:acetyl-CoA C-acetyltransferase
MTNKVCVLGAGSTKYGKLDESVIEIALNASKDAIESAGITPKDIQAGYISNVFGVADKQVHMAPVIMSNLGIPHVPGLTIESACGIRCRENNTYRNNSEYYFIFLLF